MPDRLLFQHMIRKVVSRNLCHNAGKHQQRNQVRDSHQTVQGIGNVPHQRTGTHRADDADQGKDDLIHQQEGLVVLCQISPAVLAVVGPGENGGQGKEQQAQLNDFAAQRTGENGVECGCGCGAFGGIGREASVGIQDAGQQHGKRGDTR